MKPSPSELRILKHLWEQGPQSIGEIHKVLADELGWSRSSSRKTVERMVDKGMLSIRNQHGLNIYRARAKKVPTMASMIRSFTSEVLGLDGPLPVSTLIKSDVFSPQELEELEAYLASQSEGEEGEA